MGNSLIELLLGSFGTLFVLFTISEYRRKKAESKISSLKFEKELDSVKDLINETPVVDLVRKHNDEIRDRKKRGS